MADTTRLPQPLDVFWDWQRRAACRSLPESLFFHPDGERDPRRGRRVDQAKAVCALCPVRERCLAHSLEVEEAYGTWGGIDERERFAILYRRRAAALATTAHPALNRDLTRSDVAVAAAAADRAGDAGGGTDTRQAAARPTSSALSPVSPQ